MTATVEAVEHYYGDQCPGRHADEPAMLHEHIARVERELIGLRDRESIAAHEERNRQREFAAATKREAWRHTLDALQFHVLSEAEGPIWSLIQCADMVVERGVGRTAEHKAGLGYLHSAAIVLKGVLKTLDNSPDLAAGGVFSELRRLREAVRLQGSQLHKDCGPQPSPTGSCRCPGCELIRAVDDIPDGVTA